MSLLSRYIIAEILRVFIVAVFVLAFFMVVVGVAQEAVRKGLGAVSILQLIPYLLPNALVFAVPGTLLLAICVVFGRMSADNEIVAIKSSGVSPMNIVWPVYIVSFFLSLVTVGLYEAGAVWGHSGAQDVVFGAVEEIAYGALRTQRSINTDRFSIVVTDVDGRRLVNPTFIFHPNGEMPGVTMFADEGRLFFDADRNVLSVECRNGEFISDGGETLRFQDTFTHHVSLGDIRAEDRQSMRPSHLALAVLPEEIENRQREQDQLEADTAARAALALGGGEFAELNSIRIQGNTTQVENIDNRLHRLRVESPRRWATGFSCFCFAFVGVPMAIWMKNGDYVSSFCACFLPILLVYYPFVMFTLDRAKAGDIPAYTLWTGNLVLLMCGTVLLRKVTRF